MGCFVLLTNVPAQGQMAHSAGEVLRAYKAQHGVEQTFAFLKDPVIVNSLFLKKPQRIEALGLILLLALLLWRLVERTLRVHVETTGNALTGWDKKETQKPTAFMLMTKFAAVLVLKVGVHRQLVQPLSAVQQAYLNALGVPATAFTGAPPGSGHPRARSSIRPLGTATAGERPGEEYPVMQSGLCLTVADTGYGAQAGQSAYPGAAETRAKREENLPEPRMSLASSG